MLAPARAPDTFPVPDSCGAGFDFRQCVEGGIEPTLNKRIHTLIAKKRWICRVP